MSRYPAGMGCLTSFPMTLVSPFRQLVSCVRSSVPCRLPLEERTSSLDGPYRKSPAESNSSPGKDFAGHLLGNMALYCGEVRESRRRLEPRASHRPDAVDRATAGRTRALRPQPLGCGASGAAGENHPGVDSG